MTNRFWNRFWEILPGALTWFTILFLLINSFVRPALVVIVVMIYAIYWLLRVLLMTTYLVVGYFRYRREVRINWEERLNQDFGDKWQSLYHLVIVPSYKEDISILRHTLDAIRRSQYPHKKLLVVVA